MSRAGSVRSWLSLIAFAAIVAVLDYMLVDYLISQGLESKVQPLQVVAVQFSVPILGLTFLGVLLVAIAAWANISRTMPVTALREMSQLETIRVVRAAGLALFFFSAALFGPYIIGASEFWKQMASMSKAVPQLVGSLQGFMSTIQPMMALDILSKLMISQNLAAVTLVVVSGVVGRYQRRIRRMK